MKLLLASNSPRRRELLRELTDFEVVPSRFEEKGTGSGIELVLRFARGKAEEVLSRYPDCRVLGADTAVCLGEEIFGKPENAEDAKRMLRALSGKTHSVFTGVCLVSKAGRREGAVETKVTFHSLTEEEISSYVASGLPFGKAGAYGIQDGVAVASYEGSYSNVVGLPMELVKEFLKNF